jgi:DNA topoisomerase-1
VRRQPPPGPVTDPADFAKAAGLRYVYDTRPGITRKRWRRGFRYLGPDGVPIHDPDVLTRIKSLVIPPAWVDVWICPSTSGHLQATGRDARGRKQSIYHARWREVRDEAKYEHMLLFGESLPLIRKQVEHDLALPGLPREKVLATIVRLMETTFIRVGNTEYARTNHSYGLTTMRRRHVNIDGSTVTFSFQGKSGVKHTIDINDRRLARIIRSCRDTPGYELFEYLDSDGSPHTIDAADVNEYLCGMTEQHFTAKDFRTWAGTVLACTMLREFEAFGSGHEAKKNVAQAIESVAAHLGNTPSVCRKCYVHPALIECYLSGALVERLQRVGNQKPSRSPYALRPEEAAVMHLLQELTSAATS